MPDTASTIPPYLVAILISAVVALAATVAYLFKHFSSKQDEVTKERLAWALERQKLEIEREEFQAALRLEFETKHRVILETHIKMMADNHEHSREHEDLVRREFAQLMETVAARAAAAQDKVAQVMDKMYDRYVNPRSRVKG